jgi:hypothetical protein
MTAETHRNGPCARVEAIRGGLPVSHEWDEREVALLDLAARQAADIELLEADIAEHGARLPNGRLNTALCELRQGRVALARILGQVDIPESVAPASVHANKAARARWGSSRQAAG